MSFKTRIKTFSLWYETFNCFDTFNNKNNNVMKLWLKTTLSTSGRHKSSMFSTSILSSALCVPLCSIVRWTKKNKRTCFIARIYDQKTMLIRFSLRNMCNFPFAKFMYGFTKPNKRNRFGHMTSIDCQLAKLTSSYFWAETLFCLDLSINKWIFGFIYTIFRLRYSKQFFDKSTKAKWNEMVCFIKINGIHHVRSWFIEFSLVLWLLITINGIHPILNVYTLVRCWIICNGEKNGKFCTLFNNEVSCGSRSDKMPW